MHLLPRKTTLLILIVCSACQLPAQLPNGLTISGYADAYVAYYSDSLPTGAFQKFPAYAPRSHSIGLNIAQLSAAYKSEKVRALITLHYGDIPAALWPGTFNAVQEANAGIRLHRKLWLDAGFFRTHIGAEGLYPKENIAATHSLVSFYEPYYEAGLKLTYQITKKLEGRFYLLNGYGAFEENNRKKSLGMLFTYTFSDSCSLAYSNYYGDDTPDSVHTGHTRFYNNIAFYYEHRKLRLSAGLDLAFQQNAAFAATGGGSMVSGLLAARYTIYPKVNLYARAEAFYDKDGFLAGFYKDAAGNDKPLKVMGGTLGLEYKPMDNAYIRLEGRHLRTYDGIVSFYRDGEYSDHRYEAIFSIGAWF